MTKFYTITLLILASALSSCYYDVEDELYPAAKTGNCDSIKGSFILEVEPMINSQCKSCHNNTFASAGVNLEGFDNIKAATLNGRVLQSIQHSSGTSPMPQGQAKIDDCLIKGVELWKNGGAPNN